MALTRESYVTGRTLLRAEILVGSLFKQINNWFQLLFKSKDFVDFVYSLCAFFFSWVTFENKLL